MASNNNSLGFFLDYVGNNHCQVTITVPVKNVDKIYKEIAFLHREKINTYGFHQGEIPIEYVEQNFRPYLTELVTEFLFKYFVLSFLYKQIRIKKIPIAGEPRISNINIEPHSEAEFYFEFSLAKTIHLQEWKKHPFKAPKRKNYRDIDRQAAIFVSEEKEKEKQNRIEKLKQGDWVAFDAAVLDRNNQPIFDTKESLWLKLGDEEADFPCQEIFTGKSIGEKFFTKSSCLQEYFNSQMGVEYNFLVEITDILQQSFFSFESFKNHFKLKTNKDIVKKLVEIYSFRNDLSQRRAIIEETIKHLLLNYKFTIPHFLIVRQQKVLLDLLHDNPDYQVYRMEKTFNTTIEKLAKKQVKETILIDQIAHNEDFDITNQEVKHYLNFFNRPRTKDFVYFEMPNTKIQGQESPLSQELLMQSSLREKTLNHVIHYLTRK